MNKKLIRLRESDLHKIVKESVNRILREDAPKPYQNFYVDDLSKPYTPSKPHLDKSNGVDDYGNPMTYAEYYGKSVFPYEYIEGLKDRYTPSKMQQKSAEFDSDREFSKNSGNWGRVYAKYGSTYDPSQDLIIDVEQEKPDANVRRALDANMRRALDAADKRPLHRKGSLNRV